MGDKTGIADQWGENFSGTKMDAYEDELTVPLFLPWAEHLLDVVEVDAGEAAIDVACGPGTVARLQAERVGIIVVTGAALRGLVRVRRGARVGPAPGLTTSRVRCGMWCDRLPGGLRAPS